LGSSIAAKNGKDLKKFTVTSCLEPNLAKLHYGWSPLQLHHENWNKKPLELSSTGYGRWAWIVDVIVLSSLAADESASLRSFVSCCFSAVCSFVFALRARSVVPLILLATRYLLWFCVQLGEGEKERKNRVTFSSHQLPRWGSLSPSCFRGSSPSRRCAFSW